MRLPTSSVVLKTFFGTEVAADKRLIIVVPSTPKERGVAAPECLPDRSDADTFYNPRAASHSTAVSNLNAVFTGLYYDFEFLADGPKQRQIGYELNRSQKQTNSLGISTFPVNPLWHTAIQLAQRYTHVRT